VLGSVEREVPVPRPRQRQWEEQFETDASVRNSSLIGRLAAAGAIVIAIVAVVMILFSSGTSYTVHALFRSASQIVSGDLVQVSGRSVGTVSDVSLTPNGQARLTLNINDGAFDPLPQGTSATVREASLSGVANRYVDLRLGPSGGGTIRDGGQITSARTTSEVDFDQLFNTLDAPTRRGLQQLIAGSARQLQGVSRQAQAALAYLNPAIASTSTLFSELNHDTARFTGFIVKSGNLVSDIAQRQADLSGLVSHLATTTEALASQRQALGASIQRLPGFMTTARTTFANLRAALNDLDPLVNASKPVAPKLRKLLVQLKPLAEQAVPTVRDLANIVSRPGAANDLIELTRLGQPLAAATVRPVNAHGKVRPGAFPQSVTALNGSTPELAVARPYAVDLTGWFEGFSHPGGYDANGAYSRVAPIVGVGSINNGTLNLLPGLVNTTLRQILAFGGNGKPGLVTTDQADRCPGSMERGALYYPETGFPCSPDQVPTGR
jgi:phospholipid/cholesterol/gamma-HCH transport system substrate-binding protein